MIKKWTQSWVFYHVLLWGGIFISLGVDSIELTRFSINKYLLNILIRNGLLMALVYANLLILIPKFFKQGKILAYWLLLGTSTVVFVLAYNNFLFNYLPVFMRGEYEKSISFQFVSNFFLACRYIVLSLLLSFIKDWFEQEKRMNQMVIDKLSAELNYLRAQINPHFLFNTLNNLYSLAMKKSDLAPEIILKLSRIMEYMLLENSGSKVMLSKELDTIHDYIELEKIRQSRPVDIDFQIKGSPSIKTIEPYILFPFFENAFKHGINNMKEKGHLKAMLDIDAKGLSFTIENSKPSAQQKVVGHSIGLTNLKKRLSLLYPDRYDLNIIDSRERYFVSLTLQA